MYLLIQLVSNLDWFYLRFLLLWSFSLVFFTVFIGIFIYSVCIKSRLVLLASLFSSYPVSSGFTYYFIAVLTQSGFVYCYTFSVLILCCFISCFRQIHALERDTDTQTPNTVNIESSLFLENKDILNFYIHGHVRFSICRRVLNSERAGKISECIS